MLNELDIYGVYVPGLLGAMMLTLVLMGLVRKILALTGIYAMVWHRGLFDVALYVVLLGGVTTVYQRIM
ncbi:DUF1656 domain-containing protein [Phyllobacterium myrsinacearum]|uniref:DUF1656 domain-containing protein n=1 Tax=Phyllobacterium myrsinacearum TaxID=28101 RepID=A0A839ERM5_9HYPH|nr:DUF1656 domain-containing protein [Phyllobacterium myrsinacearum]MBA8879087.1 hypothetical protein [Phyllobacterium myrsinacearum]